MLAQMGIASRLVDLYKFFISIGYIREDQIRWPPHSRDNLSIEDCRAKGYSDSAIALLQALPWPKQGPDFVMNLIRKSRTVDYSNHWDVEGGRHPSLRDWDRDDEAVELLPNQTISLSFGEYDEGLSVLLDANDGTIRDWFQDNDLTDIEGLDTYKYLEELLERYKPLEHIAVKQEILSEDDDTEFKKVYKNSKQMLLDYGWPDAFRKDDFNRDIGGMQEQWEEEGRQARDQYFEAYYAALQMEELTVTEAAGRSQ